jgi:polar amino acid transport system substrate-binding protein
MICAGGTLYRLYLCCLISFSATLSTLANAQELIVQGDLWCPYTCEPSSTEPGYVIDMMKAVFDRHGIKFRYEIVPWNRTLLQTRDGKASVAVVATRQEAEKSGLLIGPEPVGNPSDCLYVAPSNKLKFTKADDLNGFKSLGLAAGYVYSDEITAWINRVENKKKVQLQTGENPAETNAKNLSLGRLDGAIEDEQVMQHTLTKLGLEHKIILAGCGKQTPVFVAFSPKLKNAHELIKIFDDGVADLRQSKQLAKILAKYGLNDWK